MATQLSHSELAAKMAELQAKYDKANPVATDLSHKDEKKEARMAELGITPKGGFGKRY